LTKEVIVNAQGKITTNNFQKIEGNQRTKQAGSGCRLTVVKSAQKNSSTEILEAISFAKLMNF